MDNHRYEIYRSKVYNGIHKLSLYMDGIDQSSSLKETQNRIIELLHVDFETFCDTVLIAQGKSSSFMEKPADKRKDTLIQILRLDEYDTLSDYTKSLKKELNYDISSKRERLNTLKNYISHKAEYLQQVEQFNNELDNISLVDLESEIEQLKNTIFNYNTLKDKNDLILSTRTRLNNTITSLTDKIKLLEQQLNNIHIEDIDLTNLEKEQLISKNLKDQITKLQEQINELNLQFNLMKNELNVKKKKINDIQQYNKPICELCGNQITDAYKQKHIDELKASGNIIYQKALKLKQQLDEQNKFLDKYKNELQDSQDKIDSINKLINTNNMLSIKKKNLEDNISNNNQLLIQAKNDLEDNMQQVLAKLTIPRGSNKLQELINELNKRKNRKKQLQENLAILNDRLNQINNFENEYSNILDQLKNLELKLDDYNAIIHAFSKNGIQSYIIENVLPEIEEEINVLLQELTNEKISIQFITTRETKSKTSIDTLDILVNENNTVRKYETFSGGEKFRIDFASHVGLARFLARRSNSALSFFILDENLGSQDDTAKSIFIQCISKITKYFEQIMIITHINDIKDSFNHKIEIIKDINGSHVA